MDGHYYNRLNKASEGYDRAVHVRLSDLSILLDNSTLPKPWKDEFAELVQKQIKTHEST